jgi:hypothetical protein
MIGRGGEEAGENLLLSFKIVSHFSGLISHWRTSKMRGQIITVTKMDAVRRQLNTAIELWVSDGDPVAIHTLASASHDVLHQLYRKKGLTGLIFDSPIVRPERRAKWAEGATRHFNFFKHGRKDIDKTIDFQPEVNDFLILFLIIGLDRMEEELSFLEQAFRNWQFINRPEFLIENAYKNVGLNDVEILRCLHKHEFLHEFRKAWGYRLTIR